MSRLKDDIYNFLVRRDERVQCEYERYVMEHISEHYESRLKHWRILWKLNWHYRIKKCDEPLIYWNTSEKKEIEKPEETKTVKEKAKKNMPYLDGAESRIGKWTDPTVLLRQLMDYDIISFDIFDTLVFRPFERPDDLFWIVGAKLDVLGFFKLRREAEWTLREQMDERRGNREVTIKEIYEFIEKKTGIDAKVGMETELQTEMEFCYANPYMKYVLDGLLFNGKRVILTSDMYIDEKHMKELLERCGITGYEKLFISCEYACSKREGELYNVILDYAKESGAKMIHIGDNSVSDVEQPEAYEIETYYYPNVNKIYGKYRTQEISGLTGSAYRGIVNAYLHNGYKRYDAYYEFGFIYGGLFVLGYAEYIHDYVKKNQIETVLFVARDGYILKKVFDSLFEDVNTDYILCSRISNLKLSAYMNKEDYYKEFLYRFVKEEKEICIRDIFENMELEPLLEELGKRIDIETLLNEKNVGDIAEFMDEKWEDILRIYREKIEISKQYYSKFFAGRKKVLVVDIGWRGQGILALRNLERDFWHFGCEIKGMLAASAPTKENLGQLEGNVIDTYLFSPVKNVECYEFHAKNSINNILTELFAGAPHPSFKGISKKESGYQLDFDVPEVNNYELIAKVHSGILDFVKEYTAHFGKAEYMLEISGHDAYMPMKHIFEDYRFIKKFFGRYEFQDCVGGTAGDSSKQIRQIFRKFNL